MVELTTVAIAPHLASLDIDKLMAGTISTATELVGCEGGWGLMYDHAEGLLWHHAGSRVHAMPAVSAGIAGAAAIAKESVNIASAKADSRFNRFVDSLGPSASRSLIAVPMVDNDTGECTGVIELCNKHGQPLFSDDDIAYLAEV